ncbi:MAG: hypothetical protein JHD16_02155 [Solirubrobacteraceae bacterium]|nr:hypothetical protein [Solirubrobacteraceae bacterium]
MALADQLSIDRLRQGARTAASRAANLSGGRGDATPPRARGRLSRTWRRRKDLTAAGAIGFATVALPWLMVVIARATDPDLGRGRIVADPWSVLSLSWGAWALAGLLIVAALAVVAWARWRLPAPDVSRTMAVALGSLVAFAAWSAASVWLWSPSPSGAWRWTVGVLVVLLASVLGLFAGAQQQGRRGVVLGVLVTGAATALIGVIDLLVFPEAARRVVSPFDPSATAMLIGLGVLVALALDQSVHPQHRRWLRGFATLGLFALVVAASRSALLLTLVGLVILSVRGVPLGWPLLQAALGALPAAVTAVLAGGVARAGEPDPTGRILVGVLLISGVALVAWLAARDMGTPAALQRLAGDRRAQGGVAVGIGALLVAALVLAPGGPSGVWERTTTTFETRSEPGQPADASRLWNATSDSHLWRWQAALDAYQQSGDPAIGLGPGSGPQALRRYRTSATAGLTTPSAPIAVLTESGAVGLALVLIGVLGLSLAARSERRRDPTRSDAAILLTIGSVVLLHGAINATMQQPLLLVPAFAAVAALGSRQSLEQRLGPPLAVDAPPPVRRTVAAAVAALLAIIVGLGALVPARAQIKAREAETNLLPGNAGALRDAALYASQASRLDPLAIDGEAVGSQAALALQRWTEARRLALEAVRLAPQDASAWRAVAYVALAEHDRPGARIAARKLQELDPAAASTREIAIAATLDSAPPESSPTATATPLTAAGG